MSRGGAERSWQVFLEKLGEHDSSLADIAESNEAVLLGILEDFGFSNLMKGQILTRFKTEGHAQVQQQPAPETARTNELLEQLVTVNQALVAGMAALSVRGPGQGEGRSVTTYTQFYDSLHVQMFDVQSLHVQGLATPSSNWPNARGTLENAAENTVRETFVALFPPGGAGQLHTLSHAIDGHKHKLFGQEKQPDVFIVRNTSPDNSAHVECVGEIKKMDVAPENEGKGQTFSYALALFKKQPNRRFAFAFLTNLKVIVYFKVSAKAAISAPDPDYPGHFDFYESPTFSLLNDNNFKKNLQFLMYMFTAQNAADLGFVSPPVHDGIMVTECVGSGATSNVWLTEEMQVLKAFNPGFEKMRDFEVKTLQALQPPNQGPEQTVFLPTVVAMEGLENAILMTPILKHFRRGVTVTKQHIEDLFSTLAHVHANGWVHRDLRPDNVMHDGLHAYIIDFGFAIKKTDNPVAFAGAKRTASNNVLGELAAGKSIFVYDFKDDVESLAKCLYLFVNPDETRELPGRDEHQALLDFWEVAPGTWKTAFENGNNLLNAKNYFLDKIVKLPKGIKNVVKE